MSSKEVCLLLGATGVGKTLLLKRLQNSSCEVGSPPPTLPTPHMYTLGLALTTRYPCNANKQFILSQVGTNLTDLTLKKKKVTVREIGGCMGPIWPSYFQDCFSVIFMVDSANIVQISSSCIQLLSVLSAEPLRNASVLILFNKRDLPCIKSLTEIKSLFRMDDIIASAPQPVTTLEASARSGLGLQDVLSWLDSVAVK